MSTSPDEVIAPTAGEGVVYGSVLVRTDGQPTAGRVGGLLGDLFTIDADAHDYELHIKGDGSLMSDRKLVVSPGAEEYFTTRLDAGAYRFHRVFVKDTSAKIDVDIAFDVVPGQTTYLGRLVLHVPPEFGDATGFRVEVGQASTAELAARGWSSTEATVRLMRPR